MPQLDLPRRRGCEVLAAQHVRHALLAVVHDDRELVADDAVRAPQHVVVAAVGAAVAEARPCTSSQSASDLGGVERRGRCPDRQRRRGRAGRPWRRARRPASRSRGRRDLRRRASRARARTAAPRSDCRTGVPSQSRPSAARSSIWRRSISGRDLSGSRSSMRRRKRPPPSLRAQSHASSAVRAFPTCRSPLGLGA